MSKRPVVILALVVLAVLASGCAGPNPLIRTPGSHGVAGFWSGLWHGLICPVTFLVSLFDRGVRIYEVHNSGGWYDFGFLLGLTSSLGGSGRASCGRR